MTDDERKAIPATEVTAMLQQRAGDAGLSGPDRERLVRSIMTEVAGPARTAPRVRFGWRSLAASMAGLVVVLAAAGGLIVGMPASVPASAPPSAAPATGFPVEHAPLRVLDQAELLVWAANAKAGTALGRVTIDRAVVPAPSDCPTTICPVPLGVIHDASLQRDRVVVAAPDLVAAAADLPAGAVTGAFRAGKDGTLELLGAVDQGFPVVEPFVAAASNLEQAVLGRAKDASALVVSGWLIGGSPFSADGRKRLVADRADNDRNDVSDQVVLPDDAYRTWTAWYSGDDGKPDNGLFVVRPDPATAGGWRIVGSLDGDPEPDADLVLRLDGSTVACGAVTSGDCGTAAAAYHRIADVRGLPMPPTTAVSARAACPTNAPSATTCWQVTPAADGAACTIIALEPGPSSGGLWWTPDPAASDAPDTGAGAGVACE